MLWTWSTIIDYLGKYMNHKYINAPKNTKLNNNFSLNPGRIIKKTNVSLLYIISMITLNVSDN